jgi:hypothetical protein
MTKRTHLFWLVFAGIAVAVLVACSSSNEPSPGPSDAAEGVTDALTRG